MLQKTNASGIKPFPAHETMALWLCGAAVIALIDAVQSLAFTGDTLRSPRLLSHSMAAAFGGAWAALGITGLILSLRNPGLTREHVLRNLRVVAICGPLVFVAGLIALAVAQGSIAAEQAMPFGWRIAGLTGLLLILTLAWRYGRRKDRFTHWARQLDRVLPAAVIASPFFLLIALLYLMRPGEWGGITEGPWYLGHAGATVFLGAAASALLATRGGHWTLLPAAAGCLIVAAGPYVAYLASYEARAIAQPLADAPQHVLLISIDTIRRDSLSVHGATEHDTPRIDELAAESIVFTNAESPSPWTVPAVVSMLTGLSPMTHGVNQGQGIHPHARTVAEIFSEHGYLTGAIGDNPHFYRGARNMERGFRKYTWYPRVGIGPDSLGLRLASLVAPDLLVFEATTTDLTDAALEWYGRHQNRRTFLWLHYFDPHLPYIPPEEYLHDEVIGRHSHEFDPSPQEKGLLRIGAGLTPEFLKRIHRLYLAEVRYVDFEIGRLLDRLDQLGLCDDMLIVLTGDHGEEFGEHGGLEHGHTLHWELLDMPLMVKLPGQAVTGRYDTPVSTASVAATLLDVSGFSIIAQSMENPSLRGIWDPRARPYPGRPLIAGGLLFAEDQVSVKWDGFKYIVNLESEAEELYDLARDPGETRNVAGEYPERIQAFREVLADAKRNSARLRGQLALEDVWATIDRRGEEILRSLGYM